jgi:AMMECR1 domain-containing protein
VSQNELRVVPELRGRVGTLRYAIEAAVEADRRAEEEARQELDKVRAKVEWLHAMLTIRRSVSPAVGT